MVPDMSRDNPLPFNKDLMANQATVANFAQRLKREMLQRGWTQSDLARRATDQMVGGGEVTRNSISRYINGKELPGEKRLHAMAAAFGIESKELLDVAVAGSMRQMTTKVAVEDMGDGKVWLRINQAVSWDVALKVLDLVKGEANE